MSTASAIASVAVVILLTAAACTVASIEALNGQPINPLASTWLEGAAVGASGILGYHIGSGSNGNGKGAKVG